MKLLVVVGTRPEAIKMAPVVRRLRAEPGCAGRRLRDRAAPRRCSTRCFALFGIVPDVDLDLMRPDQTLERARGARVRGPRRGARARSRPTGSSCRATPRPRWCASLAAFHRRVRVGHVEAGLRTGDFQHPFPEEMNRRVVDLVSDGQLRPDAARRAGPRRPRTCPRERIYLTGNTVVDALLDDRRPRGRRRRGGPRPDHRAPPRELRRAARARRARDRPPRARDSRDPVRPRHSIRTRTSSASCAATPGLPNVDARRAARLPRARPAHAPRAPDPDGLRRHPGGGADLRQAGARPAREDGAARRASRRVSPAGRHRRGDDRGAGVGAALRRGARGGACPGAPTRTATAAPRSASRRSSWAGPEPFEPPFAAAPHEARLGVGAARPALRARPPDGPARLAPRRCAGESRRRACSASESRPSSSRARLGPGPAAPGARRRRRSSRHRLDLPPPAPAAARGGARPPRPPRLLRIARGLRRARRGRRRRAGGDPPADRRRPARGSRGPARSTAARSASALEASTAARAAIRDRRAVVLVAVALLGAPGRGAPRAFRLALRLRLPRRARGLRDEPPRAPGRGRDARSPARPDLVVATSESLRRRHGGVEPGRAPAARTPATSTLFASRPPTPIPALAAAAWPSATWAPSTSGSTWRSSRRLARLRPEWTLRDRRRARGRGASTRRRGWPTSSSTASGPTRRCPPCARASTWRSSPSGCPPLTHATDPVKLYEAAAAGRPRRRDADALARAVRAARRRAARRDRRRNSSRQIEAAAAEGAGRRPRAGEPSPAENTWDVRAGGARRPG